jgi:hypothetical protein
MGRLYPPPGIDAMGKTLRWVIPGSRLLLTDRAAIWQSGSPPRRWAYDQPVHRPLALRVVAITRTVTNTESWGATTTDNRR